MTSLPCPPAQWTRFSALLDAAMELPEPARRAWIDALAGEDAIVKPWLRRVLAGGQRQDLFFFEKKNQKTFALFGAEP
ncbi:MAG TPA: hypothetical protein VMB71_10630 [Acetobacteraceae bacterium]|nr:hypothetical protein [Acetobacteraceae bacterium]